MQEKLDYIKKTICGSTESLQEFDDELFKTLVEKVLVKDAKHVVFVLPMVVIQIIYRYLKDRIKYLFMLLERRILLFYLIC
jgi:hypothetical protein